MDARGVVETRPLAPAELAVAPGASVDVGRVCKVLPPALRGVVLLNPRPSGVELRGIGSLRGVGSLMPPGRALELALALELRAAGLEDGLIEDGLADEEIPTVVGLSLTPPLL
ncbi:uncharacterized protein N7482_000741 [Penicillium canariense]|uniref:Uncharacterized protein n=1 Tax=Penicillium canariense TaxID=189055 RepID=A0A9W9IC63_9EURO|nr:uncharacterized protein N7482_000741 [Penicillium canariense]KAJ5174864.1 hypothetical protein N7482_000741 [Penicillium canariense]